MGFQELGGPILGSIVEGDDRIHDRGDVGEPAGQEALFVARLEQCDERHCRLS